MYIFLFALLYKKIVLYLVVYFFNDDFQHLEINK